MSGRLPRQCCFIVSLLAHSGRSFPPVRQAFALFQTAAILRRQLTTEAKQPTTVVPSEVLRQMGDDMQGGSEQVEFDQRVAEAVARKKAQESEQAKQPVAEDDQSELAAPPTLDR